MRKLCVFLCHSSQDKPIVRELYQRLNAESWIDPWLDEEKLLPGHDWEMEIEKAVEAADAVIVCLSNNSVTKEGYVQKELRYVMDIALEKNVGRIFIIPLRLDEVQSPRYLRSLHYIDYFPANFQNTAYIKIFQSLKICWDSLKRVSPEIQIEKTGNEKLESWEIDEIRYQQEEDLRVWQEEQVDNWQVTEEKLVSLEAEQNALYEAEAEFGKDEEERNLDVLLENFTWHDSMWVFVLIIPVLIVFLFCGLPVFFIGKSSFWGLLAVIPFHIVFLIILIVASFLAWYIPVLGSMLYTFVSKYIVKWIIQSVISTIIYLGASPYGSTQSADVLYVAVLWISNIIIWIVTVVRVLWIKESYKIKQKSNT